MNRCRLTMLLATVPFLLAGCTETNPFPLAPVSGQVTYEDGTPIAAATVKVYFMPQEAARGGLHARPGEATLAADGTFASVSTMARDDGAVVGMHRVVLDATRADYSPAIGVLPEDYKLPKKTPLSVEVSPDGENHFILKVRKP